VGAHFGRTPKRFQSGTIDYDGRITRCGDAEVRTALYEAANALDGPQQEMVRSARLGRRARQAPRAQASDRGGRSQTGDGAAPDVG
jgi:transposase